MMNKAYTYENIELWNTKTWKKKESCITGLVLPEALCQRPADRRTEGTVLNGE